MECFAYNLGIAEILRYLTNRGFSVKELTIEVDGTKFGLYENTQLLRQYNFILRNKQDKLIYTYKSLEEEIKKYLLNQMTKICAELEIELGFLEATIRLHPADTVLFHIEFLSKNTINPSMIVYRKIQELFR